MTKKGFVILAIFVFSLALVGNAWAASKYNEAPMLKALVDKGELPPVEKRLPDVPLVITPYEEIGQYGGKAIGATTEVSNSHDFGECGLIGGETIIGIDRDQKTMVPNIAVKWDFSADKKTLTLTLRKGIKWSDGVPFTSDDIMFWWEDKILNDELTPVKPQNWSPGGKLMKMTKVDDFTVRLNFSVAYYPALYNLSSPYGGEEGSFFLPKHYMKQFHAKYADKDKLAKLVKDAGFDTWMQLFLLRSNIGCAAMAVNPGTPTLRAHMEKSSSKGFWVFQRNPYYWKVDTAGNQLPYIDEVDGILVDNPEMVSMKVVAGELDFAGITLALDKYPLYMQNADKGNYRVLLLNTGRIAEAGISINQTIDDPEKRKIFQDVRFRRALSMAINRNEINNTLFFGKAVPCQLAMSPTTDYYQKELTQSYAQYDPQKANALLDEMGLTQKGSDGIRLMPSGKKLVMTLEYWPYIALTPISELVRVYWKDVGVQLELKTLERNLMYARAQASQIEVMIFEVVNSPSYFYNWANWYIPGIGDKAATPWGNKWYDWYVSKGTGGEEPPQLIKDMYKMYEEVLYTSDNARRIQIGKEFGRLQAENVWVIGTVAQAPQPIVVRKNLRNVAEGGVYTYELLFETNFHPEQFFFKK